MRLTRPTRHVWLVVGLSLIAGLLFASAGSAHRAATTIGLPDCLGKPHVKPASVLLACGDGSFRVTKLAWTGWGQVFAAGRGTGSVNDCKPNCATGHFHSYPVILLATGRQRCHGSPAYNSITSPSSPKPPTP